MIVRLEPGFGATTMIINGAIECGSNPSNKEGANNRANYYKDFAARLKVKVGEEKLTCRDSQPFSTSGSAGALALYWAPETSCTLVRWCGPISSPSSPSSPSSSPASSPSSSPLSSPSSSPSQSFVRWQTAFSALVEGDYNACRGLPCNSQEGEGTTETGWQRKITLHSFFEKLSI